MQIVIEIPEEIKNTCDNDAFEQAVDYVNWFDGTLVMAIKNGIPLPKGHGDLIDKDVLYSGPHFLLGGKTTVGDKDFGFHQFDMFVREDIDKVHVVIMADKEDTE